MGNCSGLEGLRGAVQGSASYGQVEPIRSQPGTATKYGGYVGGSRTAAKIAEAPQNAPASRTPLPLLDEYV